MLLMYHHIEPPKAVPVDTQTPDHLSEFNCLKSFQSKLSLLQVTWFNLKVPVLSSIIPMATGMKMIFTMKHIPTEYDTWAKATWSASCAEIGSDPHRHTLIISCNETLSILQVKQTVYTIPTTCSVHTSITTLSAGTMIQGKKALGLVREWVAYHMIIGFEQFHIYVNEPMSQPPFHHDQVHWIPFQDQLKVPFFLQQAMQNDCIHRSSGSSQWLALFDVDEYFQVYSKDLLRYLQDLQPSDIGGLQVKNWFFGRNARIVDDRSLIIDKYVWRAPHPIKSGREKVIVQPQFVSYFSVHMITLGNSMQTVDPELDIRLNHYRNPEKGVWGYYKKKKVLIKDTTMRSHVSEVRKMMTRLRYYSDKKSN